MSKRPFYGNITYPHSRSRSRAKQVYIYHKDNAARRQLDFDFTFEEWCAWWQKNLGPDWLAKRGAKSGHYVMARKLDKGAYAAKNVKCILHEQNCRDQVENGTSGRGPQVNLRGPRKGHPKKLTKNKVRDIFYALGTQTNIATKYNVSDRMVRLIKQKKAWRHVTSTL